MCRDAVLQMIGWLLGAVSFGRQAEPLQMLGIEFDDDRLGRRDETPLGGVIEIGLGDVAEELASGAISSRQKQPLAM